MKEVLGILCAAVSVLGAVVAYESMKKCSELEEKSSKKKDKASNEFDYTCCDECCECFDDVDVDSLDDIDINPSDSEEEVKPASEVEEEPKAPEEETSVEGLDGE